MIAEAINAQLIFIRIKPVCWYLPVWYLVDSEIVISQI